MSSPGKSNTGSPNNGNAPLNGRRAETGSQLMNYLCRPSCRNVCISFPLDNLFPMLVADTYGPGDRTWHAHAYVCLQNVLAALPEWLMEMAID